MCRLEDPGPERAHFLTGRRAQARKKRAHRETCGSKLNTDGSKRGFQFSKIKRNFDLSSA